MFLKSSVLVVGALCAVSCAAGEAEQATRLVPPGSETGFFESGDVRLSYALDWPRSRGTVPAAVIGHGSGEVRKEACRGLAMRLRRQGIATLCYDKRGVGDSTGSYSHVGTRNSEAMIADLAADMAAGVRFLRRHPRIDAGRVGLVGNSQAGWIVPVAAAEVDAAFMIILAGPTVSVGEEIYYSQFTEGTQLPLEEAYTELENMPGPLGFDPWPVLARLDVPGLWLLGERDRSIPTPRTVALLDELIANGRPFARVVYPDAGHSLRGADIWSDIEPWLADVLADPR